MYATNEYKFPPQSTIYSCNSSLEDARVVGLVEKHDDQKVELGIDYNYLAGIPFLNALTAIFKNVVTISVAQSYKNANQEILRRHIKEGDVILIESKSAGQEIDQLTIEKLSFLKIKVKVIGWNAPAQIKINELMKIRIQQLKEINSQINDKAKKILEGKASVVDFLSEDPLTQSLFNRLLAYIPQDKHDSFKHNFLKIIYADENGIINGSISYRSIVLSAIKQLDIMIKYAGECHNNEIFTMVAQLWHQSQESLTQTIQENISEDHKVYFFCGKYHAMPHQLLFDNPTFKKFNPEPQKFLELLYETLKKNKYLIIDGAENYQWQIPK